MSRMQMFRQGLWAAACWFSAASAAIGQDWVVFTRAGEGPHQQLTQRLNEIGLRLLEERARRVAAITTRQEAERRQKEVREKILRLIGGLPEERGPLNVRHTGTVERGDYRFEEIIYESLPGFHVTANVYVPAQGSGPFPAILMPVGHSPGGKESERDTALGLARKGFVVLKYDPIGQGERLQYYDPDLRASKVGGPTQEHSHANGHAFLIGDNVARYRIWDGMRGIDYLLTRKDVDPKRIGCTGCSGGGTLTAYIAALDERVQAAAPACYITSWEELLTKLGPQDAEQTFPRFLAEGLNIADYVELFAPKPYLIASTIEDFFPLEGARSARPSAWDGSSGRGRTASRSSRAKPFTASSSATSTKGREIRASSRRSWIRRRTSGARRRARWPIRSAARPCSRSTASAPRASWRLERPQVPPARLRCCERA